MQLVDQPDSGGKIQPEGYKAANVNTFGYSFCSDAQDGAPQCDSVAPTYHSEPWINHHQTKKIDHGILTVKQHFWRLDEEARRYNLLLIIFVIFILPFVSFTSKHRRFSAWIHHDQAAILGEWLTGMGPH